MPSEESAGGVEMTVTMIVEGGMINPSLVMAITTDVTNSVYTGAVGAITTKVTGARVEVGVVVVSAIFVKVAIELLIFRTCRGVASIFISTVNKHLQTKSSGKHGRSYYVTPQPCRVPDYRGTIIRFRIFLKESVALLDEMRVTTHEGRWVKGLKLRSRTKYCPGEVREG